MTDPIFNLSSPSVRLTEVRDIDGTLTHKMCTFCFRMLPVAELWVDEQGQKWDSCGANETECPND